MSHFFQPQQPRRSSRGAEHDGESLHSILALKSLSMSFANLNFAVICSEKKYSLDNFIFVMMTITIMSHVGKKCMHRIKTTHIDIIIEVGLYFRELLLSFIFLSELVSHETFTKAYLIHQLSFIDKELLTYNINIFK